MKLKVFILILLASLSLEARMVEDGLGYKTEKTEADSTYQKWISIKANIEKKVRVFLGVDKTKEVIEKRIAEKKKAEEEKQKQEEALIEALPVFASDSSKELKKEIELEEKRIKASKALEVKSAEKPADPSLPKYKSGVSYIETEKVEKKGSKVVKIKIEDIPKLNIGQERSVSAADLLLKELTKVNLFEQKIKSLSSPDLYKESQIQKWANYQIEKTQYKKIELKTLQALGLELETINKIDWFTRKDVDVVLKDLDKLNNEEFRNLQALIMQAQDACHNAIGLAYPLQNSKQAVVKHTAQYIAAICGHKMGFYHQSIDDLLDVITNKKINIDARKKAFKVLVKDLPYHSEVKVGKAFLQRPTKGVSEVDKNAFYYYIMKSQVRSKNYKQALIYALKVNVDSNYYPRAQYAAAVSEYLSGKKKASLNRQRKLLSYMNKKGLKSKDKNVYNLVKINLARYAFQNKKLNESIKHFREMDRSHALWIESLQELAWAQLANGDEPGAIGNMHSLHAPFFKKVFKPESFAVRSIGYLNLCHYGDAYGSLMNLEKTYKPLKRSIASYLSANKTKQANYNTVKDYLKTKKTEVDGLPEKVIREVARQKSFLNTQEHINQIYDEKEQYRFIKKFIKKDKRSLAWKARKNQERIKDFTSKVKLAKTNKKYFKNLITWEQRLEYEKYLADFYAFNKEVLLAGEEMYELMQKRAFANLERKSKSLKLIAGKDIRAELVKINSQMSQLFKNNEFLRYEVFAGSGENIRYHVAGRKIQEKRLPASAKPQRKDLKWQYDGEFWQDEVGFYRSSLISNCPKR